MAEPGVFNQEIKITKERIAVLIGRKGEMKRRLEDAAKCKLMIDSREGDVVIEGGDPLMLYTVREIIKAVARGFNPDVAFLLLRLDYGFEIVEMKDFAKSKNDEVRLKGRVIGAAGKSRRVIEQLTDCTICVYGKTVGIIGPVTNIPYARHAIELLLSGSTHATVYHYLEKHRRVLKEKSF